MTEPTKSAEPQASGWITFPARIIALVIVIPLRLVYDAVRMTGRALLAVGRRIRRSPRDLMRVVRSVGRWIRDTLLLPVGRVLAALATAIWAGIRWCGSGLAALFDLLVIQPLRWLAVVVVWGFLRMTGRGAGKLGGWFKRVFLAPVGRVIAAVVTAVWAGLRWVGAGIAYVANGAWSVIRLLGSGIGYVASAVWPAIRVVGSGVAWLFDRAVVVPLRLLATGALWLISMIGRAGSAALRYLIVLPAVLLWRYVLRPPLVAIAYVGRLLWKGISTTWLGVLGALGWAWHASGRLLLLLFRLLILAPANFVWVYALRPVWQGLAWAWQKLGRGLRWLWMRLAVAPFRVVRRAGRWTRQTFVTAPSLWVRHAWQVSVRQPLRQARLTVRATTKETRQQLRIQFRGAFRRTK